jgi:hypothetical protein
MIRYQYRCPCRSPHRRHTMRQLDANQPCPSSTLSKHLVPGGNYRICAPCSIHPPVPTCNLFHTRFLESSRVLVCIRHSIHSLHFLKFCFSISQPTTYNITTTTLFTFFSCLLPFASCLRRQLAPLLIIYLPYSSTDNRTLSLPFRSFLFFFFSLSLSSLTL